MLPVVTGLPAASVNLPSPLPTRMVRLFDSEFVVTKSGIPSPFKSPAATLLGEFPVTRLLGLPKPKASVPVPSAADPSEWLLSLVSGNDTGPDGAAAPATFANP